MGIATFIIMVLLVIYHNYRTAELKQQLKHARESIEYIRDSETRFVDRCIKVEKALHFYANEDNYQLRTFEDMGNYGTEDSLVDLDEGKRAREALGVSK